LLRVLLEAHSHFMPWWLWWNGMCLSISHTLSHDGWVKILRSNLITWNVVSMNTISVIRSWIIQYHPSIVWWYCHCKWSV
jgi:hypothetical protein